MPNVRVQGTRKSGLPAPQSEAGALKFFVVEAELQAGLGL